MFIEREFQLLLDASAFSDSLTLIDTFAPFGKDHRKLFNSSLLFLILSYPNIFHFSAIQSIPPSVQYDKAFRWQSSKKISKISKIKSVFTWTSERAVVEVNKRGKRTFKIQKVNFSVVKFDNLLFWFSDLQIWWCDGAVTSVAAAPAIIKTRYYQKSIRIYLMLLFTILSKAQNFHISFQGFWLLFENTVNKFDGIKEIFYVRVNTKEARRQKKGWRW